MIDPLDINGSPPSLEGKCLQEFLVQSFWYDDQLEEEANVIHLKCENQWYRLYFDCGIIFWRDHSDEPESYKIKKDDGTHSEFKVSNIGKNNNVLGVEIESCVMDSIQNGSSVEFLFRNGFKIRFENIDDDTKITHPSGLTLS